MFSKNMDLFADHRSAQNVIFLLMENVFRLGCAYLYCPLLSLTHVFLVCLLVIPRL